MRSVMEIPSAWFPTDCKIIYFRTGKIKVFNRLTISANFKRNPVRNDEQSKKMLVFRGKVEKLGSNMLIFCCGVDVIAVTTVNLFTRCHLFGFLFNLRSSHFNLAGAH